jgi:hypothetical protein
MRSSPAAGIETSTQLREKGRLAVSVAQTYDFHLIFKGLFRCVPSADKKSLSVLLVDARSPKSNSKREPLRDHKAVIEFFLDDWRNPAQAPLRNFIQVKKPKKDLVGIYMLNREDIRIGVNSGTLSPSLSFKEDKSPDSFLMLPRMQDIAPAFAVVRPSALDDNAENCVARLLNLTFGTVTSERVSTFLGERLRWAYSIPRRRRKVAKLIGTVGGSEKETLRQQLKQGSREVNLDLKITMKVPVDAAVFVDPNPFPGVARVDPPAFMLQPSAGRDLKVWIKNRELDAILNETDTADAEEGCLDAEFVDFDFELIYGLSPEGANKDKRIPYRSDMLDEDGEVTAGGCACGGCA